MKSSRSSQTLSFWGTVSVFSLLASSCDGFPTTRRQGTSAPSLTLGATHEVIENKGQAFSGSKKLPLHVARQSAGSTRNIRRMPLAKLAQLLDEDLSETQWFVTGNVIPQYFCEDFLHGDSRIRLSTLDEYASAIRSMFDQEVSKAEVVRVEVDPDQFNTITCTWRVSGKLNLLWGLNLKPFLVHSEFSIHERNGKIQRQQDRFSVPLWDIALSSIFPFLNGIVTAPEEPPMAPRLKPSSKQQRVLPVEAWVARAASFSLNRDSQDGKKTVLKCSRIPPAEKVESAEKVDSEELFAYSDTRSRRVNGDHTSRTRLVNPKEFARIIQEDSQHVLLNDLLDFLEENTSLNSYNGVSPWQHHDSAASKNPKNRHDPNVRAVLADGTVVPAIRAPTLMDKAKRYVPDRAETRFHLNEATRRTTVRRASRYYFVEGQEGEDQGDMADYLQQI
ncbi:hypothetical protein ACA910_007724 [Epithemia clementina (nom. ined.)]